MKKIFAFLTFCLFYSNVSYAVVLDNDKIATDLLLSYSVTEANLIYQNRESYPSTQKFLEHVIAGVKEGMLTTIYQEDPSGKIAFALYKIDIPEEFPRFFQLLERGKIKPDASFLTEFSFYLSVRTFEKAKGVDFDMEYDRLHKYFLKEEDDLKQNAKEKAEFISYMKQLKPSDLYDIE